MNKKDKQPKWVWPLKSTIITFVLSLVFAYLSNTAVENINIPLGLVVLIIVIAIGIIFDLIGTAVTIVPEEELHARASKKIRGSKAAIKLAKNSAKVANIGCDVVGDVCGVISGAIGATMALKIMKYFSAGEYVQYIMTATISASIIGIKALTKEIAKDNATEIIGGIAKILPQGK